jgi:hypothetical protein
MAIARRLGRSRRRARGRTASKRTCWRSDESRIAPVRLLTPAAIPVLQEREGASPAMVARYLNIAARLLLSNGNEAKSACRACR